MKKANIFSLIYKVIPSTTINKITLSCLVLTALCFSVQSQSFPTYKDNPLWHVLVWDDAQTRYAHTETFAYTKDTAFCEKEYSVFQLHSQQVYIQVNGEKVKFKLYPHCDSTDYLLYDFDAEKGDTLYVGWNDINSGPWRIDLDIIPVIIDSVYYEEYHGVSRKTLHILFDEGSIYGENWIRGVGSTEHPFYPVYCGYSGFELYYDVLCYDSMQVNLFVNNVYNTCDTTFSGDVKIDYKNNKVTLYPNPTANTIYFEGLSESNRIKIIDTKGKIVLEEDNVTNSLDIHKLSKGLYILLVYNTDNKLVLTQKISKL